MEKIIPTAHKQLEFLQKIQLILEAGDFTSTYKFALLLSLSNLSIRKGDDTPNPLTLSYEEIAEQFIEQYWKQSLPFEYIDKNNFVLQQNTGSQIVIIQAIQELMLTCSTLQQAKKSMHWQSTNTYLTLKKNVMYCLRQFNGIIRQLVQQR